MTNLDYRVAMRVEILSSQINPPRIANPDEISASLHEVAVGIVDLGGCKILENAVSVLKGVTDGWPENSRPNEQEIGKAGKWVVGQDPDSLFVEPKKCSACLGDRIEDAIAGRLVSLPWPWESVSTLTNALLPGAITLVVGSPGASKSFMLLQSALFWQDRGIKVALYELEEDLPFWLNRALALVAQCGAVTDPNWINQHADDTREMFIKSKPTLDRLAEVITCAPEKGCSLPELADWIEEKAKAGNRIICADPLTAATVKGSPWIAAEEFMLRAKRSAVKHGASLVLTSHGRKGAVGLKTPPDLDTLAGGAAYGRFSSTAIWLEACEEEAATIIRNDGELEQQLVNRRLRLLKVRNGRGSLMSIGTSFRSESLLMHERGILARKEKGLISVPPVTPFPLTSRPGFASNQTARSTVSTRATFLLELSQVMPLYGYLMDCQCWVKS